MNIEFMAVDDVIPYEGNPRRMRKIPDTEMDAVSVVAESIDKYGFNQPIVVDGNSVVVVGHTRLAAAKRLGLTQVPAFRARGLTEEQARQYRVADNKTAEWTGWDFEKLLADTSLEDEIPGFAPSEFEGLHQTNFSMSDLGDARPATTTSTKAPSGNDEDTREFVQLSFFVRREYASEIKERCQAVIDACEG